MVAEARELDVHVFCKHGMDVLPCRFDDPVKECGNRKDRAVQNDQIAAKRGDQIRNGNAEPFCASPYIIRDLLLR